MAIAKLKITVLYDPSDDLSRTSHDESKGELPFVPLHAQIADALTKRGHQITLLRVEKKIRTFSIQLEKDQSDVLFNTCQSSKSSIHQEHHIAALLELLGKPVTGTDSLSLTLAKDPALSQTMLAFHHLPYRFTTPSVGKEDAIRTFYVGVLGNDTPTVSPIFEWHTSIQSPDATSILTPPDLLSSDEDPAHDTRWEEEAEIYRGLSRHFPSDISPSLTSALIKAATTAYRALRISGYGCIELFLRKGTDEFCVSRVLPNPSLSKQSEFVIAWRKQGVRYPQLLEKIIELALDKHKGKIR